MLVPLSWLKDYVALPANPADLVERLTLAGLESSGVKVIGLPVPAGLQVKPGDATPVWERDKIVVATVLKIEKHPDADKLKMVTVDHGTGTPKTVVTGAPNIAPGQSGMKVILGLQGSRYYYNDKDGKKTIFTLEPKALRGVMNDAMCMSNFELGIAEDHDGIIILDDSDPAPGTPAVDVLGDIVVELDVLPNMARCLGLLGIAREVAALTGQTICEPAIQVQDRAGIVNIAIADAKLSQRYIGFEIEGATVGPAPRWMRSRLQAAGMRPISNIVDITNYVMLETSQPLHAFDLDVLKARGGSHGVMIAVRPAIAGEKLKTLDGVERTLRPENLVIADAVGPIALAGVMGGFDTEVTDKTKNILLEAAHFDFVSVRKTARQFNLFSEASTRFSRGLHPDLALKAGLRAAELIVTHAQAKPGVGIVDHRAAMPTPATIELNRSEIDRLLGVALPDGEVERILLALDFKLTHTMWGWSVTPPANRTDIQCGAADLIEDLARVSGYDRLPERLLAQEMPPPVGNRSLELEEAVRDLLVDAGLYECITYSLCSSDSAAIGYVGDRASGMPEQLNDDNVAGKQFHTRSPIYPTSPIALKNAVSPERSVLRTSLIPNLMEVTKRNLETNAGVALFELGPVFLANGTNLPDEPRRLCVVLSGRRTLAAWDDVPGAVVPVYDFFDLKGIVETLCRNLHLMSVTYQPAKSVPWLHPAKAAEVLVDGKTVGSFGEMHPRVASTYGLAEKSILVGEFDLELILNAVPTRFAYVPFSTFPPAKRDVAVIVPGEMPAETVLAEIKAGGGELLASVDLFDVYTGDKVPAGTKSLAFACSYQAADRTLGDKEIQKAHEKVEGRLRHVLKAQIRGKDV